MPDVPPSRVYGAPMGPQAKVPGVQRNKPQPGNASEYMKHMIEADQAFHAKQSARPTGRSGGLSTTLAKGSPPVGTGGMQRREAIDRKVREAGG